MIPAVYVHESRAVPYAQAIAQGYKPIETRTRDVLGRFVGHRVLIIRTRSGHKSDIIGSAFIADKRFCTAAELDDMRDQTLIPPGSQYDCHGRGKWCYTMSNAVLFKDPLPLDCCGVDHKTRSYAMLTA